LLPSEPRRLVLPADDTIMPDWPASLALQPMRPCRADRSPAATTGCPPIRLPTTDGESTR
jgi:hypothetical protein